MITRRKDYTKRAPSKDASKIYIISEGTDSEIKYLNFFVGLSSNLELIVIPSENGTDPMKLRELPMMRNRIVTLCPMQPAHCGKAPLRILLTPQDRGCNEPSQSYLCKALPE